MYKDEPPLIGERATLYGHGPEATLGERTRDARWNSAPADISPSWRRLAFETVGLKPWRWSTSDTHCLLLPGGDRPPSRIGIRDLLRDLSRHQRHQLAKRWRALRNGLDHTLELDINPISDGRWWRVRARVTQRDDSGAPVDVLGVTEIVPGPALRGSECVKAHAFAASRDPMLVVDEQWRILEINHAFMTLIGVSAEAVIGASLPSYLRSAVLDGSPGHAARRPTATLHEGVFRPGDATRSAIPVEITLSDFTLSDSGGVHYIAALRDISARKRSERELEHLASIDTLTQLPNRTTLQYRLSRKLEEMPSGATLSILFIDLDGFKHINDSLGHQAGDRLLQIMVERLKATLRGRDLIARWGGDEFVVVLETGGDSERSKNVANRLLDAIAQPLMLNDHQIAMTASIGIVHSPDDGNDSETLLQHADVAMYAAKDLGKNAAVAYRHELKHSSLEQMSMLSRLRVAINEQTLDFVVQPKFDGASRIVGAELLARWSLPDCGPIPPSIFVPLAEHNGMASALGNLAIEHAARYAAVLAGLGYPLPVAVNISALHVMDENLARVLGEACARHAITTDQIELEVTESIFLENTRAPEARIEHLRQQGFRVAMDDFGAGYSSLGYLKRLPFDTIKIDRSFMCDLADDPRARDLLAGIVGLCALLGMETVAEGVETLEQWELLQSLGVAQYQGFYLGRPMSMNQLIERLGHRSAESPKH
ncbi:putative bifunctional diguanylate cyclase/phosphodiesterase [Salinicola halophilus]|uniref:putative bifunctional diguanylate cyclase/phosphodiesterase n=1 Tax=Salinicola halophilus TaxID=184065 RepID=UPI000DA1A507|nr:EAL domain-containing protein [Salinicola halophilus]